MEYSRLAELYEYLEGTSSRLKKTEKIARFLMETEDASLEHVVLMVQGKVFPSYSEKEIGIASKMMIKTFSSSTGFPERKVVSAFREMGDLGLVAEKLSSGRRQKILASRGVKTRKVFENLRKIASVEGTGSQDKKMSLIKELLSGAEPKEAKYIVRTVLGELRIGVAKGILRDSITDAFFGGEDAEKRKEIASAIESAWFVKPDYSEIVTIAKRKGLEGLRKLSVEVGKPYHVLLAQKAKGLGEALGKFKKPQMEFKYDGARVCIHKKGKKIWIFTRRLEDITRQFPDLVEMAENHIKSSECIVEGEMLAINPENGDPMPFQKLSQRIKRKYDIRKMSGEIPIQVNLFDVVMDRRRNLFSEPLDERRKLLDKIINPLEGRFQLAKKLVTKDIEQAKKFYERALEERQEGVMVKNLESDYRPGRRVGYWLKVKPTMESLDLVITGAEWGTGKRTNWLGSFILSCRKGDRFLECGMMGTGIKEKGEGTTFKKLTDELKNLMENEEGKTVKIKPKLVVEVAYEEIQKSTNYSSGFALRFPRMVRMRPDKSEENADTVEKIKRLYVQQRGGKLKEKS